MRHLHRVYIMKSSEWVNFLLRNESFVTRKKLIYCDQQNAHQATSNVLILYCQVPITLMILVLEEDQDKIEVLV